MTVYGNRLLVVCTLATATSINNGLRYDDINILYPADLNEDINKESWIPPFLPTSNHR